MKRSVEIKKGVHWVGGIDWDLRDFHGYSTNRGSTYNAYLLLDDKITLVDTVKYYLYDEMMERISSVVDPAKIEYVVSNHVEMDHSGSLPMMMKVCPDATVITSPNGEKGLKKHYGGDWKFKVVNTGDTLNIGARTLNFVLMQMVHWPDSMATYIPQDKLLLPNDAFGQHIASPERFDDELGWGISREEAAKYYANIVLPYGAQVKKALGELGGLDIDMIAPSHGIIWREHLKEIISEYVKWSDNATEKAAVIVYSTMWGSTAKMAGVIHDAFTARGYKAYLMDLKTNDISDVMTKALTAEYICVGSPTLNNGMMPPVGAFLTYLKGLAPKGRKGLAFGSFGWGGQSVPQIEGILKGMGFDMMESAKMNYIPAPDELVGLQKKMEGALS